MSMLTVSLVEGTEEMQSSYADWGREQHGVGLLNWRVGGAAGIKDSKPIGE